MNGKEYKYYYCIDGNKVVMINSIIFNCTCWIRIFRMNMQILTNTHRLKGASAMQKANAIQGLPELVEISNEKGISGKSEK